MEERSSEAFIKRLEQFYGRMEPMTSCFGSTSFGKIADDLCISASQFSKLMNDTATEGMYIRSLKNIDRLIKERETQLELERVKALYNTDEDKIKVLEKQNKSGRMSRGVIFGLALLLGFSLLYALWTANQKDDVASFVGHHPLTAYFDRGFDADFDSPYLKESEVQDYCPCSAYEGEWSLGNEYKLPLPGNRKPGVYYVAKSADVRMKCLKSSLSDEIQGQALVAYEYLINEVWVDTELTPLSPRFFDKERMQYTSEFEELKFEDNAQFQRVAVIHSFFIDRFEIQQDSIYRSGEPCGRFATDVNQELVKSYEIDLKHVLENVLGDLNKTDCKAAYNLYCDPNDLKEQESLIEFACRYTISSENLGIGGGYPYTKSYRLEKQNYSDNLTCHCEKAN